MIARTRDGDTGSGATQTDADRQRRTSAARLAGVQGLYEIEMSGTTADSIVIDYLRERWSHSVDEGERIDPDPVLFKLLVNGVSRDQGRLDEMIAASLEKDGGIERLDAVLRAILRAGAYELFHRSATPSRVVINEYVELAKAFYADNEPNLVNGILDRLGRLLRPGEMAGEMSGPNGASTSE